MATIYVRSTDGNNSDNGSTWALAKATLAGADGIDAAGDSIYVSQVHSETTAASVTLAFAGTKTSPTKVVAGNDGAAPPTALSSAAVMTVTGASSININGSIYCYGITFTPSSANGGSVNLSNNANEWQRYESCNFYIGQTIGGAAVVFAGGTTTSTVELINCNFKFGHASEGVAVGGNVRIKGGAAGSGGSPALPTAFIKDYTTIALKTLIVEGHDFNSYGNGIALTIPPPAGARVIFRNCKTPANGSWTLLSGSFSNPGRVEAHGCNTSANYALWVEDYCGTIIHESTIIKTGGASDGTTGISWKMTTGTNVAYPFVALQSPEIVAWNSATGSSKTLTVDIVHDSLTNLKDNEVWLEAFYLGTSSVPIASSSNSQVNVLTTAADLASSTATWTTTGLTNPNKQKLTFTFTPQVVGFVGVRVCVAKASKTIYVDPKVTIS